MSTKIDSAQFDTFQQLMKLGMDHGCGQAALDIIKLLRHAVTPSIEMVIFEAWQLISAGQILDARRLLEEAVQNDSSHCEANALLATALFFDDDPLWQTYAFDIQTSESADPTTRSIVDKLNQAAETGLPIRTIHHLMFRTSRTDLTATAA